ncbi:MULTISPECIES: sensor histidine kinase [Methanocalculus]|uniref:sensor histidine kinase n=1 Tax=Methanocalculus TaxID=71151 RepID=UPI00209FC81E|nr:MULTISPECIES: sensor histidine kinase [unclassified Methanocalculus]MCP1662181.1 two-component sensor histidine kinase [Methanocalculus sp. AMF5]
MLILEKKSGAVVAINRSLAKTFGTPEGLDLSLALASVIRTGSDQAAARGVLEQKIRNAVMEERESFIQSIADTTGTASEYLIRPRLMNLSGREYYLLSLSKVAGTAETELLIEEALAEKEVLLREVHHRVKNNLQVISSLINLQAQFVDDPLVIGYLTDSQNRVRALGYVYEHLYRTKELGLIDFSEYTTRITQSLLREYSETAKNVSVEYDVQNAKLNPDTSVPLGLLLNELVSNALRHAFPDEREGTIKISMHPDGKGRFILVVADDGVGIPSSVDIGKTRSLGLLLVSSLVSQLDGAVDLKRTNGTTFTILFKPLQYRERS